MDNKIYLPRTGVVITERCNLRCKLCAEYAPYYRPVPNTSYGIVKKCIDTYFLVIDRVGDLSILGGEPLLNKDVYEILYYISQNYIDRIDRLLLLTNGTIMPKKDEILKALTSDEIRGKFQISISNYGKDLSKRTVDIKDFCDKYKIKCRIINYYGNDIFCDGWVDYGDHSKKFFSDEETRMHAQKCNFRKSMYSNINFEDKEAFFSRCGRAYWRYHLGITSNNTNDVIRFPDKTNEKNICDLRKELIDMIASEYSDSCSYCNGMCDDSPRFKPAEQLTLDEYKKIK